MRSAPCRYRIDGAQASSKRSGSSSGTCSPRDELARVASDVLAEARPQEDAKRWTVLECVDSAPIVRRRACPLLRRRRRTLVPPRRQTRGCPRTSPGNGRPPPASNGRQPQLVGLSEQSRAVRSSCPASHREMSCSVEPESATPGVGREPSASFRGLSQQRLRAHRVAARALGGRFEPHCHLFVRANSGTGSVPGSAVGIIGRESRQEQHAPRPPPPPRMPSAPPAERNQGMPEPEAFGNRGCRVRLLRLTPRYQGRLLPNENLSGGLPSGGPTRRHREPPREGARAAASASRIFRALRRRLARRRAVSGSASNPGVGSNVSPICRDREARSRGQRVSLLLLRECETFEIFGQVRSSGIEQRTRRVNRPVLPIESSASPGLIDIAWAHRREP